MFPTGVGEPHPSLAHARKGWGWYLEKAGGGGKEPEEQEREV